MLIKTQLLSQLLFIADDGNVLPRHQQDVPRCVSRPVEPLCGQGTPRGKVRARGTAVAIINKATGLERTRFDHLQSAVSRQSTGRCVRVPQRLGEPFFSIWILCSTTRIRSPGQHKKQPTRTI